MNSPRENDSLSRTLAEWRVAPGRNPAFRAEVWARIEGGVSAAWPAYARRHVALVGGVLAVAVTAGALAGHERARAHAAAESARLASAYVQEMDARSMRMP